MFLRLFVVGVNFGGELISPNVGARLALLYPLVLLLVLVATTWGPMRFLRLLLLVLVPPVALVRASPPIPDSTVATSTACHHPALLRLLIQLATDRKEPVRPPVGTEEPKSHIKTFGHMRTLMPVFHLRPALLV